MDDKIVTRKVLIAIAVCYLAGVGLVAMLKSDVPLCSSIKWPEVFYGPAITIASTFAIFFGPRWLIGRIRK